MSARQTGPGYLCRWGSETARKIGWRRSSPEMVSYCSPESGCTLSSRGSLVAPTNGCGSWGSRRKVFYSEVLSSSWGRVLVFPGTSRSGRGAGVPRLYVEGGEQVDKIVMVNAERPEGSSTKSDSSSRQHTSISLRHSLSRFLTTAQ